MADFSHLILRDILGAEIDFESPLDEDLLLRMVNNIFSVATMVDGQPNSQFKAQANGNPTDGGATSTLTIDTITEGVFERDDQYNTKYILVTSGVASGQGIDSRFPIVDSIESTQQFIVGENRLSENLFDAGMLNNDQFQVMGHVHDGVDGEKIRVTDIDFDVNEFLNTYTEAGKAVTRSETDNGGTNASNHAIILPSPGEDYFIWGTFRCDARRNGPNIDNVYARIKINGVLACEIQADPNTTESEFERGTGTFCGIIQDGQNVTAENEFDGPGGSTGTATSAFDILSFQKMRP